jgi:CheY-like chemotaxis protein
VGGCALEDLLTILEDDPVIPVVIEDALAGGGYNVVCASSGERAIELLDAPDAKYRAIVTDINLGREKLDGWEVARHAREIDPSI